MSTVYQRILKAAKRGTGCYLTDDDVVRLAGDDAVRQVGEQDNERDALRRKGRSALKKLSEKQGL